MIATLKRYVLREIVKVFVLSAIAVIGVVIISFSVRLLNQGINIVQLRAAIPFLVLFALPFAVPCGLLIAVVLAYGRMAGQNELLAVRAHGISLWQIITPALVLAMALTVVGVVVNNHALPLAYGRLRNMTEQAVAPLLARLGTLNQELDIPPYLIYVGSRDPDRPNGWRGVVVAQFAGDVAKNVYWAERGSYALDVKAKQATLTLDEVRVCSLQLDQATPNNPEQNWPYSQQVQLTLSLGGDADSPSTKCRDRTWQQLCTQLAAVSLRMEGVPRMAHPHARRTELRDEVMKGEQKLGAAQAQRKSALELQGRSRVTQQKLQAELDGAVKTRERMTQQQSAKIVEETQLSVELADLQRRFAHETDAARARTMRERITRRTTDLQAVRQVLAGLGKDIEQEQLRADKLEEAMAAEKGSVIKAAQAIRAADAAIVEQEPRLRELRAAFEKAQDQEHHGDLLTEIHLRLSQAMGSLVFVLIGIPLGMLINRGSAVIAFGASLGVVLVVYYPLYSLGRMLASNAFLTPGLALWIAPAACALLGLALFVVVLRR